MKSRKITLVTCWIIISTCSAGFSTNSSKSKSRAATVVRTPRSGSLLKTITTTDSETESSAVQYRKQSSSGSVTQGQFPLYPFQINLDNRDSRSNDSSIKNDKSTSVESKTEQPTSGILGPLTPSKIMLSRFSVTICASFLTWWAQKRINNIMASSIVTLVSSIIFKKHLSQAAFCGAFAGMTTRAVIPSWQGAIGLGILTSTMYEWLIHAKNMFLGIGGRLSMAAFIATSICAAISNISTGVTLSSISSIHKSLQMDTLVHFAFWHALGSVVTLCIRKCFNYSSFMCPYRSSAIVGLIGSLLINDYYSALALYGGSFVGMSYPNKLLNVKTNSNKNPSFPTVLLSFGISGLIAGLIKGITVDLGWWTGGWGGKTGSCALLGCLIFRGIASKWHNWSSKYSPNARTKVS